MRERVCVWGGGGEWGGYYYLGSQRNFLKVAQQAESCDVSAGGGSKLSQALGRLGAALLHAADCTCHQARHSAENQASSLI